MRPKKVTTFPLKSRVSGIAGRLVEVCGFGVLTLLSSLETIENELNLV